MKKSLLILSLTLFTTAAWSQDFTASQRQQQRKTAQPARKVSVQERQEGAIQRGVRKGNVLQMVNVFAPVEYGNGSEFVYYDEYDPFQRPHRTVEHPKGIKLFGFVF